MRCARRPRQAAAGPPLFQPLLVLELGAGTGRFSLLFLHHLRSLLRARPGGGLLLLCW